MKLLLLYSVLANPVHRPLFFQNEDTELTVTKFNPNHRLISTAPGKQEWMTEQQVYLTNQRSLNCTAQKQSLLI